MTRRAARSSKTGASTKMTRTRGRAMRGERLVASVPHGHWKMTTFLAGLRHDGITAPLVLDGPMNLLFFIVEGLSLIHQPGNESSEGGNVSIDTSGFQCCHIIIASFNGYDRPRISGNPAFSPCLCCW